MLRLTAYPLVMAASLAAAWLTAALGLPEPVAIGAAGIVSATTTLLLELTMPYRREWLHSTGDLEADLYYALLAGPATGALGGLLIGALAGVGASLSAHIGLDVWPSHWSLWAQLPLALVAAELGVYWIHRLEHTVPLLWRFHAVHHSAPRVYFLNAMRSHPFDSLVTLFAALTPLVLLGIDARAMFLYSAYATAHMFMQHSNIDLRIGPLNWVFSMPEVHRWHHSTARGEMDANYGGVLLVWDVLLGTRRVPEGRLVEPADVVGIADLPEYPAGFAAQLLSPFVNRYWKPPT